MEMDNQKLKHLPTQLLDLKRMNPKRGNRLERPLD
jgi:hypothetical protein